MSPKLLQPLPLATQFFKDYDSTNHNSDVYNATGKFPLVYGFDFTKVVTACANNLKHTCAYAFAFVVSSALTHAVGHRW